MKDTLDQRWGFPPFVTSDYQATHSTVRSADAGMDEEMPAPQFYGSALQAAVQAGQVSAPTLNQMVRRILREMFRFNEFNDPPTGSTSTSVPTLAHQAISTEVAEAGTVLRKNRNGVLPLDATGAGSVAVIGPAASAAPTDTGGGSVFVTSPFNVTPLQGIQSAAGSGTTVSCRQGLPADTSLSPTPSADLSPAYASTGYGGTYVGTLTAPETGTHVLGFQSTGSYTVTNLFLDGKEILANPGTPPISTYSIAVNLQGGQRYTITLGGGGPSANLSWATPSDLAPEIQQAVSAAKAASTAVVVVSDSSTQTPHPVSVYFASVPLDPGKTVASVTLPTVGSSVGNGIVAMHIFSIAAGNGTPTSGGASALASPKARSGTSGEAHFKAHGRVIARPPGR